MCDDYCAVFFENDIPMNRRIATALTFGIRMDTMNLSRGVSKLDVEMLYRMFDLCDADVILNFRTAAFILKT